MSDLFNKLLILRTAGIGPVKYNALVKRFGGVVAAAESLNADVNFRDSVKREMENAEKLGISYITDDDGIVKFNFHELRYTLTRNDFNFDDISEIQPL